MSVIGDTHFEIGESSHQPTEDTEPAVEGNKYECFDLTQLH